MHNWYTGLNYIEIYNINDVYAGTFLHFYPPTEKSRTIADTCRSKNNISYIRTQMSCTLITRKTQHVCDDLCRARWTDGRSVCRRCAGACPFEKPIEYYLNSECLKIADRCATEKFQSEIPAVTTHYGPSKTILLLLLFLTFGVT